MGASGTTARARVSVESVTEAWQTAQVVSSCSGSGTPGCRGVAATAVREEGGPARRPAAVPRAIPWKSNRTARSRDGRRLGRIEPKLSASARQFKSGPVGGWDLRSAE